MNHISKIEKELFFKLHNSKIKHMKLDLDFPFQEIYDEIYPFLDNFVEHRIPTGEGLWKSLTLHGHHMFYTQSGKHEISDRHKPYFDPKVYGWTQLADICDFTTNYFKSFPCKEKNRIRFMLLEPNGYIKPHSDNEKPRLFSAINFAVYHPKDCLFNIGNEFINWKNGEVRAMNTYFKHWVKNNSKQRRLHMILHGNMKIDNNFIRLALNSYEKYRNSENWDQVLKQ